MTKATVLKFPKRPKLAQQALGWVCGCGGTQWVLYENGDCLCTQCEHISLVIKVSRATVEKDT